MTTRNHPDAIRPDILGLLELLDHYLEEDEGKHSEAVVEAACATDADAPRRLGMERYGLKMAQENRLEVAVLRQRIHQLVEKVERGEELSEALAVLLPVQEEQEERGEFEEPLF